MKRQQRERRVRCIAVGDSGASLIQGNFYHALPDEDAATHGLIRVIDESGEDYLYPAENFVAAGAEIPGSVSPYSDLGRVFYSSLWGHREAKYHALSHSTVEDTAWDELTPLPTAYHFSPRDLAYHEEYVFGWSVAVIFSTFGLGVQTSRDALVIGFTKAELIDQLARFADLAVPDDAVRADFFPGRRVRDYLPGDTRQWSLAGARRKLASSKWEHAIQPLLYRPFDVRYVLYSADMVDWPRPEVMGQMLHHNLALIANRQSKEAFAVLCATGLTERKIAAVYDASSTFPVYLYPEAQDRDLFNSGVSGRHPNFSPHFLSEFSTRLAMEFVPDGTGDRVKTFGPEDVFHYMYAVFHSPSYRKRYAEFLKIDFPRLPLTTDAELFRELCGLGVELTGLHVMEKHARLFTRYPVAGDDTVVKPRYTAPGEGAPEGRVWINQMQYFGGVPPEVWEFRVGGYQVAEKWLKDRKGRPLTYDDLTHYQRILAAVRHTIELMAVVDEVIDQHAGWPLAGSAG
jgi:predicted helicase